RLGRREARLTRLALVYGLGMTNNWAMVGLLPVFLAALIWIQGLEFFNLRFLARMAGWGCLGVSLYLLLPLVLVLSGAVTTSFWDVLWWEVLTQKNILVKFPKYILLLVG